MRERFFRKFSLIFMGLLAACPALAANVSYYYCRASQGPKFTDFALTVTANEVILQPYASSESPGTRIYHGKVARIYGNGNVLVDFNSYSQIQFLSPHPNLIFTQSLFVKAADGAARVLTPNPANDTIMSCAVKKTFFAQ